MNEDSPFVPAPTAAFLPASDVAEKGLICSFLLCPEAVGGLCAEAGVSGDWFANSGFGIMHGAMAEMWSAGQKIDNVTLTSLLIDRGSISAVGGASAVSEAFTFTPTATNAAEYIGILREKRVLREIIKRSHGLAKRAQEDQEDVAAILEEFGSAAVEIAGYGLKSTVKTTRQLILEKVERMSRQEVDGDVVETGITKLDEGSPMKLGSMPVIAAESKVGKSMLAITIAANVLQSAPVLYFSLEDRQEQVIDRFCGCLSRIPIARHNAWSGLNQSEMDALNGWMAWLSGRPLVIRDDVHELAGILAVARQWKAQQPDGVLMVVDYAQLVKARTRKHDTRETEVAAVSRALRLLSIELKIAVIVLSQLNKGGDTRESKALEQDCTQLWKVLATDNDNVRRISVEFQRNGASRISFRTTFRGEIARFENYAGEDEADEGAPAKKPFYRGVGRNWTR